MEKSLDNLPKWLLEITNGNLNKANTLKESYLFNVEHPTIENQPHYTVNVVAEALDLSKITIRQYLRRRDYYTA